MKSALKPFSIIQSSQDSFANLIPTSLPASQNIFKRASKTLTTNTHNSHNNGSSAGSVNSSMYSPLLSPMRGNLNNYKVPPMVNSSGRRTLYDHDKRLETDEKGANSFDNENFLTNNKARSKSSNRLDRYVATLEAREDSLTKYLLKSQHDKFGSRNDKDNSTTIKSNEAVDKDETNPFDSFTSNIKRNRHRNEGELNNKSFDIASKCSSGFEVNHLSNSSTHYGARVSQITLDDLLNDSKSVDTNKILIQDNNKVSFDTSSETTYKARIEKNSNLRNVNRAQISNSKTCNCISSPIENSTINNSRIQIELLRARQEIANLQIKLKAKNENGEKYKTSLEDVQNEVLRLHRLRNKDTERGENSDGVYNAIVIKPNRSKSSISKVIEYGDEDENHGIIEASQRNCINNLKQDRTLLRKRIEDCENEIKVHKQRNEILRQELNKILFQDTDQKSGRSQQLKVSTANISSILVAYMDEVEAMRLMVKSSDAKIEELINQINIEKTKYEYELQEERNRSININEDRLNAVKLVKTADEMLASTKLEHKQTIEAFETEIGKVNDLVRKLMAENKSKKQKSEEKLGHERNMEKSLDKKVKSDFKNDHDQKIEDKLVHQTKFIQREIKVEIRADPEDKLRVEAALKETYNLRVDKENLEAELKQLRQKEVTQEQIHKIDAKTEEFEEEITRLKAEHEKYVEEINQEIATLKAKNALLTAQKARLGTTKSVERSIKEEEEEKEKVDSDSQTQIKEVNSQMKQRLSMAVDEITLHRNTTEELKVTIRQQEDEIKELKKNPFKAIGVNKGNMLSEMDVFKGIIQEQDEKIEQITRENTDFKKIIQEQIIHIKEMQRMNDVLERKIREKERIIRKIDRKED